MEKKLYLLMAIVSTIFSSCMMEVQTEDLSEYQTVVLQAVTESDGRTRTSLGTASGGVSQVLWTAEDRIGVYPDEAENPVLFRLVAGEGKSLGDFSGPVSGHRYSAVYPYEIAGKRQLDGIAVTLPEQQDYVPGTFAPGAFPMAATETADGTLSFCNLCAILKLSVTGHQAVTAIEFIPKDPAVKVSGPASVSFPSGAASPVLTFASDAVSRVLLQVPGVLLDERTATDFYVVLPAQSYKGGFTVRVHTSGGSMDKVYGADFTMDRSTLHASTPFELRLDKGVEPSLFLSGSGTIEDPLRIESLGDLLLMQAAVNAGSVTVPTSSGSEVVARTAHYRLTKDLDLSPICGKGIGKHWTPIGDTATDDGLYFGGSFDGGGHSIRNLYIDNPKDYQGLFGRVISMDGQGLISNLTVSGYVHGKSSVGLIAGYGDRFESCASEGESLADGDNLGGIAGWGTTLTDCINRASVTKTWGQTYTVGGIVGRNEGYFSLPLCRNCRNEGKVSSLEGYQIGGILGFTSGIVYNCTNTGEVYGGQQCGGIAGYLSVSSVVANCINMAPVSSGYGYSGGIAGVLNLYSTCRVVNCVSLNTAVERSYGTDGGAICGYNGGTIEQCYGLASASMVATNAEGGTVVTCQPVTPDQFSDADAGRVLYLSSGGIPCTSVCQALNAWAYDNRTEERIYSGWGCRDGSLYLTGEPAADPSGGEDVFRMIPDSAEMGPEGGSLPIRVYSTIGYHLSSVPSWIEDTGKTAEGQNNFWVHNFTVSPNTGEGTRTGVIVFCNDKNVCIPVTVLQYGTREFNWAASFAHQSLLYHFSATWSGFCPEMTTLIADWQQKNPGRFQRVVFHATNSELAFSGYGPLEKYYRVDGLPAVILDGRIRTNNLSDYLALSRETENVLGTKTGIGIRSSLSGRKLSLDLDLYCKKGGSYKVVVLLLEDKIVYRQDVGFYGNEANYVHNDVARMALTDVLGDAVTASDRSQTRLSYSVEIPSSNKIDNMRILAYVLIPGNYEFGSYVDNCVSVKAGSSLEVQLQ